MAGSAGVSIYSGPVLAGVNVDVVRDVVLLHQPEFTVADVVACGEGQDDVAFDVDGELIVRFRKAADDVTRAALVTAEARLLDEIAGALPVAVPEMVFLDAERGCLAYRKLPGTPLLEQPRASQSAWAEALGIEHVLVEPRTGAVTGIIDWSDAAMVDPAHDVGLLYRDLGPAALAAILRSGVESGDAGMRERAVFYARCSVLEDLAYGHDNGRPQFVEKSLAAFGWLFERQSATLRRTD